MIEDHSSSLFRGLLRGDDVFGASIFRCVKCVGQSFIWMPSLLAAVQFTTQCGSLCCWSRVRLAYSTFTRLTLFIFLCAVSGTAIGLLCGFLLYKFANPHNTPTFIYVTTWLG